MLAPTPEIELSGTMLSHFDIGEVIAKGTGGVVFQARDLKDDSTVAFKVLDPNFSKQEEQKRRFIRAMKTMLPLRHPNLVAVYSAGKTGPYCWISMEYVEGESLAQVIKRIGTAGMLDWRYALRVAVHIGRGLAFAHAHRIIHRNLGPSNILIRKSDSRAKLGDLMLAKALEGVHVERITRPGDVVGNAHYMAPEQVDGRPLDERSDLFSLGSTIYAVLTGRTPFEGSTLVEIIKNVQSATPVKPTKYQPSISAGFEEIVLKLLAKRPEERYRSAKELLTDLDRVVRSEPQLPTDFYKEAEPEPVPGAKAVERTETVVEALPAAAIRQKTRVEKAPAKPVVRTDTVVEAFSPSHVESQDRAEESSTATPRGQVHWMWLVGTGVVALAAIAALIVVLLTRR